MFWWPLCPSHWLSKQESHQTQLWARKGLDWFPLLGKVLLHVYFLKLTLEREEGRERREREREPLICYSIYLRIHWLLLVWALTGDGTCSLGVRGQHSHQLSYPARAALCLFWIGREWKPKNSRGGFLLQDLFVFSQHKRQSLKKKKASKQNGERR